MTEVVGPDDGVVLLKHCRCNDCRRFYMNRYGEPTCEAGIGGTCTTWGTGRRFCDPPPEVWHYCSAYDGPQISTDVWPWPRPVRSQTAGDPSPVDVPADAHGPVRPAVPRQVGLRQVRNDPALW